MEILVGLDVSLASTSGCALGANGKTVNEAKAPSDPGSRVGHLRGLPGKIAAAGLEAGPLSQWLHKCGVAFKTDSIPGSVPGWT